jgi:hypothetical protein
MNLRVLLIEPDHEYIFFLREVLIAIKSGRFWSNWMPAVMGAGDFLARAGRLRLLDIPVEVRCATDVVVGG